MKTKTELIFENMDLRRRLQLLISACTPTQLPQETTISGVCAPPKDLLEDIREWLSNHS